MLTIIECPTCYWQPDGEAYWTCSCGHSWNTFETKGKCPNCQIQWETTRCPGCGKTTPHKDWYVDTTIPKEPDSPEIAELKRRKKNLETRLISLGIKNYRVAHLPFMDYSKEEFQSPYDVGCRLIILYAISYLVHNLDDRPDLIDWLKSESLWDKVSEDEKAFFVMDVPSDEKLLDLSSRIEGAILLGWVLNLYDEIHDITSEASEEEMDIFVESVPELVSPTKEFLESLKFRSLDEIYEENLLNEIVTTYLRDLHINGNPDETEINDVVSFERHITLNWVRKFMGISDWDETDTAT